MPTGFESSGGVMAGYEALARLIAIRKKDEIVKQEQIEKERQFQIQEQQLQDNAGWREMQIEEQRRNHEAQQQYRQDTLNATEENRKRLEANSIRDDIRNKFSGLAGGTHVSAEEYAEAIGKGALSRGAFTPDEIDINKPGPQTFKYAGGAQWQQKQDAMQQQLQIATDNRLSREQMHALTTALTAELGRRRLDISEISIQPDTSSETGVSVFNKVTGERVPIGGAGLLGGAARQGMKEAGPHAAIVGAMDDLIRVGDQNNWEGVGLTGGLKSWAVEKGLTSGSPQEVATRAALASVRSFVGHERYGAALTEGEKQTLNQFIGAVTQNGLVTRQMAEEVREIEARAMQRALAGPHALIQQRPGADMGTKTPTGYQTGVKDFQILDEGASAPAAAPPPRPKSRYDVQVEP